MGSLYVGEMGSTYQSIFHRLLGATPYLHGVSAISTSHRREHELRKFDFWINLDYKLCGMARIWKTSLQRPGKGGNRGYAHQMTTN